MPAYWICKVHHQRIDRGNECHQCLGAERDALRARVAELEADNRRLNAIVTTHDIRNPPFSK